MAADQTQKEKKKGRLNMAKEDRGFASMDPVKQREIASKGGKASHQKGTAHEWNSDEARLAGLKSREARRHNRELAANSLNTEEIWRNLVDH